MPLRSLPPRTRLTAGLTALGYALLASVTQIPGCSGSTGGDRVTLETRVEGRPAAGDSFTNGAGWQLTVDRALVSVGPLAYVEGTPVGASAWLGRWGLAHAFAHPGHFEEGGTVGESPASLTVDLLEGPTSLGTGPGVTGTARSARFSFQVPPMGALGRELGNAVARVEGSARKEDITRTFLLTATEADLTAAGGAAEVLGCPLADGDIRSDGTVTLTIDLAVWLDQVDFSELDDASAPELPADGREHRAFVRGLLKSTAYSFTYSPRASP